jgi:hypothetical protein
MIMTTTTDTPTIVCPHVSPKEKSCKGHVVAVEAYKADVRWNTNDEGSWLLSIGEPRSHYHVFCSCGHELRCYLADLPESLAVAMKTAVATSIRGF